MERRLGYKKLRKSVVSVSILCVLVVSCTDPVSAYVATKQQQNIRKEFDSIDATLVKADSVINKSNLKTMQALDSLNKVYFDSNAKR